MIDIKKTRKYHVVLLLALTIGTYYNSLSNDFTYDDSLTVVYNSFIKDWSNISGLFSKKYFSQSGEATYRPVVTLAYFIDYSLWQLQSFGYHLTNLAIHLANIILLYFLVVSLTKDAGVAFWAALLFAMHPVQTEAVNAVSYREDILTALFLFPSFHILIKLMSCDSPMSSKAVRSGMYFLSLLLFLFALLSKETAASFPLLLTGYFFWIIRPRKKPHETTAFLRFFVGYVLVSGAYFILYFWVLHNPDPSRFPSPEIYYRLLAIPFVALSHVKIILLPWELNADYNVIITWFPVLVSIFILLMLGVSVFLSTRIHKKEMFGIWWFFVTLLPVLNIFPINHMIAERYLYLPMGGVCLFFASALSRLYRVRKNQGMELLQKKAIIILTTLLFIVLMMKTMKRNMDWKNEFTLWSKTVISSPGSFVAHYGLGLKYAERGEESKAVYELKKALQIKPDFAEVYYHLGILYVNMGFHRQGIHELKAALGMNFTKPELHFNMGIAYAALGIWEEASKEWETTLIVDPNFQAAKERLKRY